MVTYSKPISDLLRFTAPGAPLPGARLPGSARFCAVGVATVSFATLLLELSLTRLFSVVLFYHFAFLAISVALLGLGAGGVFTFLFKDWLKRWDIPQIGLRSCWLSAIAIVAMLEIVLHVPVSLQLTTGNLVRLSVIYFAAAVPFFFTGLQFSVVFAREGALLSRLYAADLLGGAAACLVVVPLLNWIGGPNAVLASALMMAVSALLWSKRGSQRWLASATALLLLGLIVVNFHGRLIDIVFAKGMRRDLPWVLFSKWNAISRVEVDQQGEAKYVVIDADASTAVMSSDPAQWQDPRWQPQTMATPPAMANLLRPHGKYAIIGPGGGVDVLRAVSHGSTDVTGIEINPIIANDVMRDRYADYTYHLYQRPEVHIHVSDGRSFVRQSKEQYDVLQMTLVDTWASTAAGAFALSENNLYTTDAFREYFDHLKPDGMIAITRWEFVKPREALRVVAQAMEALHQIGVADPRSHFLIVSDGELNVDGRPVAVLAKKSPFTEEEEAAAIRHIASTSNLALIYSPHSGGLSPGALVFKQLIETNNPRAFADSYAYNVMPVDDNAPFFFFTFKTGRLFRDIWANGAEGIDWKVNIGVAVLFLLLVISLLAVAAFLILPLALHPKARLVPASPLFYFVAIGVGYIFVEMTLIQRFVLFLGHPTYALTVVIFLMLLSSGAGSLAARKKASAWLEARLPLAITALLLLVCTLVLPRLLEACVGLSFAAKLIISGIVLIPLGFVMGMPFPLGLRSLSHGEAGAVEWAWAINAASTVLGSVLAMVVALHFGLAVTMLCGAAAYLGAAGMCRSFTRTTAA